MYGHKLYRVADFPFIGARLRLCQRIERRIQVFISERSKILQKLIQQFRTVVTVRIRIIKIPVFGNDCICYFSGSAGGTHVTISVRPLPKSNYFSFESFKTSSQKRPSPLALTAANSFSVKPPSGESIATANALSSKKLSIIFK